jgi:hypothetical protein
MRSPFGQGQQKGSKTLARDGPPQPTDVEAGRTQHRVQRIPLGTLQPASIHVVVQLGMPDGQLYDLTPLEPAALLRIQGLELATVNQLHGCNVMVDAAIAQVHHRRHRLGADVFEQRAGLLQRMSVVGVAGEAACAHHQAVLVGDGQADLDAELVGLARFALGDALDPRCMQRVPLVLVVALLMRSARSSPV